MGGGSSSSASSSNTQTTNTDKRLVVSDQAIGLSSDSSTVNITMADQGAIAGAAMVSSKALDAVSVNSAMSNDLSIKALDTVSVSNAMQGQSFSDMLRSTSENFKLLSAQSAEQAAAASSAAASAASSASAAVADANRQAGANYNRLLDTTDMTMNDLFSLADKALTGGFNTVSDSMHAISQAVDTANSKGTLDNRTITILGVSAAVAVAAFAMRK